MATPKERLEQFCRQGKDLPPHAREPGVAVSAEKLFVWRSLVLEYLVPHFGEASHIVSAFSSLTDPNQAPLRSNTIAAIEVLEQAADILDDIRGIHGLLPASASQVSRALFISHATRDADMVKAFVRMLEAGTGLPQNEIFCTSMPGSKIQGGRNFRDVIRREAAGAKMLIALITPAFLDSAFCWSELGAGWVLSQNPDKLKPFVVDPVEFSDVGHTVIGGLQTFRLTPDDLSQFRDEICELLPAGQVPTDRWDEEKALFLAAHCSQEAIQARKHASASLASRLCSILGMPEQTQPSTLLEAIQKIVSVQATPDTNQDQDQSQGPAPSDGHDDAKAISDFLHTSVTVQGERSVIIGSRVWEKETTWRDVFVRIGRSLESASEGLIRDSLAKTFAQVTGNATISDPDWNDIQLEFTRRGLVDIRKSKTTRGSVATFWSLTDAGQKLLNESRG